MITNFKSFKSILAGLYRDLGSNTEINEGDAIEWISEALSMIGSYSQMIEVSTILEVTNHQAKLPCGFAYPKDISYGGIPLMWSSKSAANNYNCPECNTIPTCCSQYNFYISDGFINTNIQTTENSTNKLCLTYLSIPVDEEGFPLVPDNVYFDKALKAYVTYMLDRIQYRRGLVSKDIYKDSEKDWLFYVNSARGSANMPDTTQMERLKSIWVRLIPRQNSYASGFRDIEGREQRKLK